MPQVEQKVVRVIQPNLEKGTDKRKKYSQKRVAAYCRVSTQQEEQINSYEVQTRYYTEKINAEPKWKLVQIFADRGISGTSTKHRGEFNKMIRMCKRGRIDMIITKSRMIEHRKSSIRCKVEHPFNYLKSKFGFRKVRYRGIAKNFNKLNVLFACINLLMWDYAKKHSVPAKG